MLYHLSLRVAEAALFSQNDRGDKSWEFRHHRDCKVQTCKIELHFSKFYQFYP